MEWQWNNDIQTRLKFFVVGATSALVIMGLGVIISPHSVDLDDPAVNVAIVLLELIALLLPALAITLQVAIDSTRKGLHPVEQDTPWFRGAIFLMAGIVTVLLSITVFIIGFYMDLPIPLSIALAIIAFAVYIVGMIPAAMSVPYWRSNFRHAESRYDHLSVLEKAKLLDELSAEEIRRFSEYIQEDRSK